MYRITDSVARRALPLFVLLLFAGTASAQVVPDPDTYFRQHFTAHATFGIGACAHGYMNTSVAGGADVFLWRGITLGGEIGYFRFVGENGFGVGTMNVGYNFANRRRPGRFEPYVNFGAIGAGFASGGSAAAASLGGGVNTWISRRIGIRTEGRFYAVGEEPIAMLRIGLSFR